MTRLHRRRRPVAACAASVICAATLTAPALAATRIRIDTVTWPTLAVSVVLPRESSSPPRLYENGRRMSILYASNVGSAHTIALAVDHSQSMHGQALRSAIAVARQLLAGKGRGDRIAVFAIGSKAVQLTGFSRSTRAGEAALAKVKLDPHYGTALYDGVVSASQALQSQLGGDKVLILVTDGQETTSRNDISRAAESAAAAKVAVYPVAIKNLTYKPGTLDRLARATRGAFFGQATRATRDYAAIAGDIRRTWRIDYTTGGRTGETITLRVVQQGSAALVTRLTIPGGSTSKPFLSNGAVALLVLAALGAIALLAVMFRGKARRDPRSV